MDGAMGESTGDLMARVRAWIDDDQEPGTVNELRQLTYAIEDHDRAAAEAAEAELRELFRDSLSFGTAGLLVRSTR